MGGERGGEIKSTKKKEMEKRSDRKEGERKKNERGEMLQEKRGSGHTGRSH